MSGEIRLFLVAEIDCKDCFKTSTIKVGVGCDSRNTVIVEPWNMTLAEGWMNLQFAGPDEYDEGYVCGACANIREAKHEANEAAKEELIEADEAKQEAETKLSKKEVKEAEKLAKKKAKKAEKAVKKIAKKEAKAKKALKEETPKKKGKTKKAD